MSRNELGPAIGLSSGSISNVVAELAADGLVEEAGSVESEGGRPRTLLRIVPGCGRLIGVDVGETRIRVELLDLSLTELARTERPLDLKGHPVEGVAELVASAVHEVLDAGRGHPGPLLGVGIGVPGIVAHTPEGAVVHGPTVGWDAVPLESVLRRACQLPTSVDYFIANGAGTLGQAEMWFGAGRGTQNAVVVLFGSGVGACVVTGDAAQARAVEWGHLTVRVRGRRCRCGALGCLEAYAGAEALLDRWREAGGQPPIGADEETALAAMMDAAHPREPGGEPEPTALAIIEETAEYLGAGLSDLVNLFQPDRVLVGGWAGLQLGERFLTSVRRHLPTYALSYPASRVSVELGRLGPDAVTVGAATLPLAAFFARGGRPPEAPREAEPPAWQGALRGRALH